MEIIATVKPSHTHRFEIKNGGVGTCACGEMRKYVGDGKDSVMQIIKAGDPNYRDSKPVAADPPAAPVVKDAKLAAAKPIDKTARHEFYQKHKMEILGDIANLGRPATERKWKIPSGSMTGLKKAWASDWPWPEFNPVKKPSDKVSQGECPEKDAYETADLSKDQIDNISRRLKKPVVPAGKDEERPVSPANKNIVEYWRRRAELRNTGAAERVIMTLTADMLEAKR